MLSFSIKLLNKLIAERDWSAQEVSHILLDIPQERSSRTHVILNCYPEDAHKVHYRMDQQSGDLKECGNAFKRYKGRILYPRGGIHLKDVTLLEWLQDYDDKHYRRRKLNRTTGKSRVLSYFPTYISVPGHDNYENYCRVQMMLNHPFTEVEDLLAVEETDGMVVDTFAEAYDLCLQYHGQHPDNYYDPFVVDEDPEPDDADYQDLDILDEVVQANRIRGALEDWSNGRPGNDGARLQDPDGLGDRDLDRAYDWGAHVGKYPNLHDLFWDEIQVTHHINHELPPLNPVEDMNAEQRVVYDLFIDHYRRELAGEDPEQLRVNLDGVAGTGKTYVLLQACRKLSDMAKEAGKEDPSFRAAPTGVAAHNFKGTTLHRMFKVPIQVTPGQSVCQNLSSASLTALQALYRNKKYLIIDEKSMIGINMLTCIDHRLRQIFPERRDEPWGGVNTFLCGDFNQLPPIGSMTMYASPNTAPKTNPDFHAGRKAYLSLDTTARLITSMRQNGQDELSLRFKDALQELRTNSLSISSFDLLQSRVMNTLPLAETKKFKNALRLYQFRAEVKEYNHSRLRDCAQPILNIRATHEKPNSPTKKATEDDAGGLYAEFNVCIRAQVMMTRNLWVERGLVNGTMCTVQDITWEEGKTPGEDMPFAIIIKVEGYDGPCLEGTENWIPIFPITNHFSYNGKQCCRTNFPLTPAYAITIHKSQGLTLPQVVINFDQPDRTPGLSYVAVSRVKHITSLLVERSFDKSIFDKKKTPTNEGYRTRDWNYRTGQMVRVLRE
jgi:ATP-dependent DNA helicase PIF1